MVTTWDNVIEVRESSIIIGINNAIHMHRVVNEGYFLMENSSIIMKIVKKIMPTRSEKRSI